MSAPSKRHNIQVKKGRPDDITRILGIDPGFGKIGWGVIEGGHGDWVHVAHGCIETDAKELFVERLSDLRTQLAGIIARHAPTRAAVEELFFYKNVTTAIDVGQARGVILLTLADAGLAIDECTPLQVKQAMTGNGRAEKMQVQAMVPMFLHMTKERLQDDAADALAVALTAGASLSLRQKIKAA